jgi:two-component system sensor histidine kinase KdpD
MAGSSPPDRLVTCRWCRAGSLLENLLDLSRLQTGVVDPIRRPVSVDEVVHRALIGIPGDRVRDTIPDDLPLIDTDAGLLERVIANITFNAVRYTPAGTNVRLLAGEVTDERGRHVQIRIVDHGPGVPIAKRDTMFFAPFQRLGDVPGRSRVGLGLAVARGLADAVDATIEVDDTPGGGLTMIVTVPVAETAYAADGSVAVPDRDASAGIGGSVAGRRL